MTALASWLALEDEVNGRVRLGMVGVRDPDGPCEWFDGRGYDGSGRCDSDGHYLCVECSHLSPDAPRFQEYGRAGRADRLRLFWARPGAVAAAALLSAGCAPVHVDFTFSWVAAVLVAYLAVALPLVWWLWTPGGNWFDAFCAIATAAIWPVVVVVVGSSFLIALPEGSR